MTCVTRLEKGKQTILAGTRFWVDDDFDIGREAMYTKVIVKYDFDVDPPLWDPLIFDPVDVQDSSHLVHFKSSS